MKDKLNELLRNVMKLLAARDKVLWEGEAGKGDAGGGDCVSCVVATTENAEITLNAYHAASHATPIAIANLNVVRIK